MCFSAEADLLGSIVIGAIGVDVVLHVEKRRDHLAFAALPLLFAAHQFVETFVWWGLEGHVSHTITRVATYLYLAFAFVVLPTYVPLAIRALEPAGRRSKVMDAFVVLGLAVSATLAFTLIRGPVTSALAGHHIAYVVHVPFSWLIVPIYVVATCCSALASGYRHIAMFGVLNLVAVAIIAYLTVNGFASVWCGWAALTSVAIAWHLRFGEQHRSVIEALA